MKDDEIVRMLEDTSIDNKDLRIITKKVYQEMVIGVENMIGKYKINRLHPLIRFSLLYSVPKFIKPVIVRFKLTLFVFI